MSLFYVLVYKGCPLAYTFTKVEAMTLADDMPLSMEWQKIWANAPEDLCLPHVGDVPAHVWKVLSEIDLKKMQEMT